MEEGHGENMLDKWLHRKPVHGAFSIPMREYPEVYNKEGRRLEFFYLRDQILNPYSESRYFLWDRSNYGLDTHFYSQHNMLYTDGKPIRKYGLLAESREIVPDNYKLFDRHPGLAGEFENIFTYDAEILNKLPNAKFYPGCADIWYGKKRPEIVSEKAYERKTKNVSFLSSDKAMCEMHRKRGAAAQYCYHNQLADVFGKAVGGDYVEIERPLTEYRFSFAIENSQTDYYFTEKITNCFAAQTIPIYLGAGRINEFFNTDGIILITEKELENIEDVLTQCTEREYERRLPAVIDNYHRVWQYKNAYDWLYEHYFLEEKRDRN